MYCTVPEADGLGLFSTWLIVLPDPAMAPAIPPVMVPIVHVKVLGAEAVNVMLGLVALQIVEVFAVVTTGVGFTVTTMV